MNIVDVTNENFKDIVLSAGKPFILDFWAPWCVYCRKLSPVLDRLSESMSDKINIGKVNIVYEQELIEEYSVMSSPVLIFFKNGEEVDRITGAVSKHKIEEAIEKNK